MHETELWQIPDVMYSRFCQINDVKKSADLAVFQHFYARLDFDAMEALFEGETRRQFQELLERVDVPRIEQMWAFYCVEKWKPKRIERSKFKENELQPSTAVDSPTSNSIVQRLEPLIHRRLKFENPENLNLEFWNGPDIMYARFCRINDLKKSADFAVFQHFYARQDFDAIEALFEGETLQELAEMLRRIKVPRIEQIPYLDNKPPQMLEPVFSNGPVVMHARFCRINDLKKSADFAIFQHFYARQDFDAIKAIFDGETLQEFCEMVQRIKVPRIERMLAIHRMESWKRIKKSERVEKRQIPFECLTCKIRKRSTRKTGKQIEKEEAMKLEEAVRTGKNEEFLEIYECSVKGRSIRSRTTFKRNDFVIEYRGDLLSKQTAHKREKEYSEDSSIGSYMYFFKHKEVHYCIDATQETPFKGRLINHSALNPNLRTKAVELSDGSVHLLLIAHRDIEVGEELLYDYGDRSRGNVINNPWLVES
ncbi:hypothetical protein L596_024558 [Steinernema carpocapsae]|uniref:[histone H4]-lysine(20) N-methyltransferase n=1 Tax=Steinernema carpocapsae TaxID=34508 RepID=A0A4U5MH42_STECR|nr:hypothetical protein L596_024558 [Steinernema carpocapsae]